MDNFQHNIKDYQENLKQNSSTDDLFEILSGEVGGAKFT